VKKIIFTFIVSLMISPFASAMDFGLNVGVGVPFASQYGLDVSFGPNWGLTLGQSSLSLDSGIASVELASNELLVNWFMFSGSFYLGVGVGQETLEVTATNAVTSLVASANVSAPTTLARLGWMWGRGDGGLWFGIDFTYIMPSASEIELDTSAGVDTSDTAYQDALSAAEQFGKTAYTNITFARLGYLF
jgi:hypothetical protein